jgi:hypothetical protein
MAKRKNECSRFQCSEMPVVGGLCQRHHDENVKEQGRTKNGLELLNGSLVDGRLVTAGPMREEVRRIQHWWGEVCAAETSNREHPVLKDETRFGTDWCIDIAAFIVDEERALRTGNPGDISSYKYRRDLVWERFANLENGLMSNGVARPEKRIE